MRGMGGLTVFIALFCIFSCPAMADELERAQAALVALKADLQSRRVVRAEVLMMSYGIETPVRVYPEMLKNHAARNNGIFSIDLNGRSAEDLIRAIDGTELQVDTWGSDLRWGAIFFDQSGTPMHTIYLNSCYFGGAGRRGYIDGARVRLNRSLIA